MNLALFVHVLTAFVMVGALVTAAAYLFAARRDGSLLVPRSRIGPSLFVPAGPGAVYVARPKEGRIVLARK